MRGILSIAFVFLACACLAVTNTSPTAAYVDVNATKALCTTNDVLFIPAGTVHWTNTLDIAFPLVVVGPGPNLLSILDDVPQSGGVDAQSIFTFHTQNGQAYFVGGMTIGAGYRTASGTKGLIRWRGVSHQCRVDNITFKLPNQTEIVTLDANFGVVSLCTFFDKGNNISMLVQHNTWNGVGDFGDSSWASATALGSSNAWFQEDCVFTTTGKSGGTCDIQLGGRAVQRYCYGTNVAFTWHGTETGGRTRGCRSAELYHLWVTNGGGAFATHCIGDMRAGTGGAWSNQFFGIYNDTFHPVVYRDAFNPPFWALAMGTNLWDLDGNLAGYFTGTVSAQTYLQAAFTGTSWTPNQWTAYSIYNAASNRCGVIYSNTANTVFFSPDFHDSQTLTNKVGDTCTFYLVQHAIDCVGSGPGDLISGNSPTPGWVHEPFEPFFASSNLLNGVLSPMTSPTPLLIDSRNFTNTMPTNYVPYPYPHPLRNLGPPPFPPFIIQQPQSAIVYVGATVPFTVVVQSATTVTYQWYYSAVSGLVPSNQIAGATSATYVDQSAQIPDNGYYFVACTNSVGNVTSQGAQLTVSPVTYLANGAFSISGKYSGK